MHTIQNWSVMINTGMERKGEKRKRKKNHLLLRNGHSAYTLVHDNVCTYLADSSTICGFSRSIFPVAILLYLVYFVVCDVQ